MGTVKLPFLPAKTNLGKTLSTMKAHGRSAVITAENGDYWVVHAGAIVSGKARGAKSLSDLRRERSFRLPVMREIATRRPLEVRVPGRLRTGIEPADLEKWLDGKGHSYALPSPIRRGLSNIRALTVLTANMNLAQNLGAGPSGCYCTNPNIEFPHSYNPPPVPSDGICHCGYKIDCVF